MSNASLTGFEGCGADVAGLDGGGGGAAAIALKAVRIPVSSPAAVMIVLSLLYGTCRASAELVLFACLWFVFFQERRPRRGIRENVKPGLKSTRVANIIPISATRATVCQLGLQAPGHWGMMAPLSMPNVPAATGGVSSIASTNSILELGKSEEPFEQQIQEACSILDIDMLSLRRGLEKCVCSPMQKEQKCHLNAPRYEWTLNWLLKKLREKNSTDNACLLPEAWLLLRFLIVYAHPAKVARSLTSNKYTETLKSTLDRLRENPVEAVVRPSSAGMSSELDATKSNSLQRNVDEVNSQDIRSQKSVYQTSKKRKRDEAEISIYEPYSGSLARTRLLFASITGTLVQTEYLLESQTRVSRSIVREQLKYVLRSSSEVAATILGSGIYLVNFVGQREYSDRVVTFQKSEVAEVPLDLEVLESYARIFLTFWGQRAYSDGKEAEHSRFVSS